MAVGRAASVDRFLGWMQVVRYLAGVSTLFPKIYATFMYRAVRFR